MNSSEIRAENKRLRALLAGKKHEWLESDIQARAERRAREIYDERNANKDAELKRLHFLCAELRKALEEQL